MKTWIVCYGSQRHVFYTDYHAAQYCRALELHGVPFILIEPLT